MANFDSSTEIKFSSHADLLNTENSSIGASTMAADFGRAFVQSAAIDPVWNGFGQLVSAGNLPRFSITNEANARQSQGDAWAQKFGSAFGVAADFVLLSRGKRAVFGPGQSAEALASMSFQERAMKQAWDGVKLGTFYGAVLTPSDPKENLLWGRVANAGSQALTFGLMNYGSEFLGSAKMFKDLNPGSSAAILKNMTATGLAGMPAGALGAVADAKLHGRELTWSHVGNAAIDYGVIGFAMAGLNHGIGTLSAADANGVTTARHITDSLGLSNPALEAGKQAEFRVVDGNSDLSGFYSSRLDSAAPAETVVMVQQKLHGALSGMFGDRFASYGEARPMFLSHGNDLSSPAKVAGSIGLIATCDPLMPQLRGKDVFPARSNAADTGVWLQPKGDNGFRLSLGEKPALNDLAGFEPVLLGLPRLPHVDARTIEIGKELDVNDSLKLFRDADGELFAEGKPGSQGIWTRLNPGVDLKINPADPIFSSDVQIDPSSLAAAAAAAPGSTVRLRGSSSLLANVRPDGLHITGPASVERIYTRVAPGNPVEVSPNALFIHLGPEGILPITNHKVVVPRPEVERPAGLPDTLTGTEHPVAPGDPAGLEANSSSAGRTDGGDPLNPVAPKTDVIEPLIPVVPLKVINPLEVLKPAKERPVVDVPVEDLGTLASRLTGQVIDPKDSKWRSGKFGDVVLDTAIGGVDAGDGTIRIVFGDHDSALSAGRFSTGIFKRRLQTDPNDRMTAPSIKVTVDEFQDLAGTPLFVPVLDIRGVGAGRLVLGDNLRPLGVQNAEALISIDQKPKR